MGTGQRTTESYREMKIIAERQGQDEKDYLLSSY